MALQAGIESVRNGTLGAFLTDVPTLQYYSYQPPCTLTVTNDQFGPSSLVFGMPMNHSLAPLVDEAVRTLRDTGEAGVRGCSQDDSSCH